MSGGFRALVPDHVWQSLLAHGSPRTYDSGEVLVRQGDVGTHVVMIREGRVKVIRSDLNGMEVLLEVRCAGDLVGEMAVIDGEENPATVTALQPCATALLSARQFSSVLRSGDVAVPMIRYAVSRRRESDQIRVELSVLPVSIRLVRILLRLVEAAGTTGRGEIRLDLGIPQEDLASAVGASRSQVAATLARLRARGVLSTGRGRIVVRDPASLRAIGAGRLSLG